MRAALALAALLMLPSAAAADWLITPFVGTTFGFNTNLLIGDPSAGSRKITFGGSVALLSDRVLGVEGTVAHVPNFFEGSLGLVLSSSVSTASGRVIVAVPQAITGYSLRPYLAGGVGLMTLSSESKAQIVTLDSNMLALDVGGGAVGMLSDRTGVRFELRHYRNLEPDDSAETTGLSSRISFWTANFGVVFRF